MSVAELAHAIRAAQASTGGWPYYAGRSSRLEPTCWALLAQKGAGESTDPTDRAHAGFLHACQRRDGLLLEEAGYPANLAFNALAALAALDRPERLTPLRLDALQSALVRTRGVALGQVAEFVQDNSLRGWPWIDGTFSWVEPTAWSLLALKKLRGFGSDGAAVRDRVDEAERVLIDRCCAGGGWNYGNSRAFGHDLAAYVPTTALGLLALQDRRGSPAVAASLEHLRTHALSEPSGLALAMALLCFRVYGIDTSDLQQHLLVAWQRTRFLGNLQVTSLALYALTCDRHDASALRL